SNATTIVLSPITLNFVQGAVPVPIAFFFSTDTTVLYSLLETFSSLKTNRDLEVGFVYQDLWTRKSTVLASVNNTLYVPQKFSINQNRILVDINHPPPYWADTYKLVVKTNPLQYYTIFVNLFYRDGLYRWIKLEGSNRDKVKEGDVL